MTMTMTLKFILERPRKGAWKNNKHQVLQSLWQNKAINKDIIQKHTRSFTPTNHERLHEANNGS